MDTQNSTHFGFNRDFSMGMAAIQRYNENHMKTVDFEDETNMVERGRKKRSAFGASEIFNIMASKPHISMRLCVFNFIHFLPSRVSRIKINRKIVKFN